MGNKLHCSCIPSAFASNQHVTLVMASPMRHWCKTYVWPDAVTESLSHSIM